MKLTELWRHSDFLRLWSGQTLSVFGSMVGATAISFTAILFLHATPLQMGVLNAMQIVPGFPASLFAGVWAPDAQPGGATFIWYGATAGLAATKPRS